MGVKSTSQLNAASPQGAGSTHARDPVKVRFSLSASRRNVCAKHVSLQHRCHSVLTVHEAAQFAQAILAEKQDEPTQERCAATARSDGLARVEGVSPEG